MTRCCLPSAGASPRHGTNSAANGPNLIVPSTRLQPHTTAPASAPWPSEFARDVTPCVSLVTGSCRPSTTVGLFDLYHDRVNPTLRQAVATATALREMQYRAMTHAGMEAEGQARWAMWVVAGIAVGALLLSSCIAVVLTRRVVGPVSLLTQAAEALGAGDFTRRVDIRSPDELGRLAAGFNRMAAALAEMQRLNVAQVLEAKGLLEATLEAIPDAVLLCNAQEQVVSANQAARVVLGLLDHDTSTPLGTLPVLAGLCTGRAGGAGWASTHRRPAPISVTPFPWWSTARRSNCSRW